MGENKIESKKRFIRFFSHLKARYFPKEGKRKWQECTIINANLKGMSIKFYTHEKINVGSTLCLEIAVPTELAPISLMGVLRWIDGGVNNFVGGIEYIDVLDDDKFAKLGLC